MYPPVDLAALPEHVQEHLRTYLNRVRAAISARYLWDRVFTPDQREHLGGDVEAAFAVGGTVGMWMRLHGVNHVRALLDVARALNHIDETNYRWLLRETGEALDTPDDVVARVVPTGALVLIESTRQVFWRGEEIAIDWTRNAAGWTYLWELARAAKQDVALDRTVFSATLAADYLAKTKSRLSGAAGFPTDLADRIHAAGSSNQRLDVPRDQIRLFRVEEIQVLREWTGTV